MKVKQGTKVHIVGFVANLTNVSVAWFVCTSYEKTGLLCQPYLASALSPLSHQSLMDECGRAYSQLVSHSHNFIQTLANFIVFPGQ